MSESAESERARIEQLLTRNQRVSVENCAMLRERVGKSRPKTVAGTVPWSRDTVARHAHGRCSHDDVGVAPAPPATPKASQRGDVISRDECDEIRERVQAGEPQAVVAQALERSPASVSRHASGGCPHSAEGDVREEERP
jgi:hypothetical protein